MPSDRAVRLSTFGFAILFTLVVVLGYIPGLNAPVHQHHAAADPGEHMLLGRYAISLLDDVTHGLTALLLLAASLHSARISRLALAVFGSYYAVDAAIYLITGLLQGDPIGSNLALNLPHVVLSSVMLWLAYSRSRMAELRV
ncbi:MAG TPA: DUF4383 domain-containing protein [Gemmatimonadaceae bacterium]|nr:DUF4383 domain-containing protein [Gemmatimonadaceae bacterium]